MFVERGRALVRLAIVGAVAAFAGAPDHFGDVTYVDWTAASTGTPGFASGFLSGVPISYYGDVGFAQVTGSGTNYWARSSPPPYNNPAYNAYVGVPNMPPDSDIVALYGGTPTVNTVTFSPPITDPIMLILSIGRTSIPVRYHFVQDFTILSSGNGYWGGDPAGSLTLQSGNVLLGIEGHGAIQFHGTFDSISWTAEPFENWHGFTFGVVSQAEVCNGLDDNLDGRIDDGCDDDGDGWCDAGMAIVGAPPICVNGIGDCDDTDGGIHPGATEVCNGRDDNCNQDVDEGLAGMPDLCNGLDDNCDGAIDEGDPGGGGVCATGLPGICGPGVEHCQFGILTCVGDTGPSPEVCNGLDDDCNGFVDEICTGKVTGGGEIAVPGGEANFGFVVKRKSPDSPPVGQLEYRNHARDLNVHSVSISFLGVFGAGATFGGYCLKNGEACTFTVSVADNGEPGNNVDRFTIEISGEPVEGDTGPITRGNIQVHTP